MNDQLLIVIFLVIGFIVPAVVMLSDDNTVHGK
jgi:hypothetical protein